MFKNECACTGNGYCIVMAKLYFHRGNITESVQSSAGQAEGNSNPIGSLYLYSHIQLKVAETRWRLRVFYVQIRNRPVVI